MLKITGKYNNAVCYASSIEEAATAQIQKLCDSPVSKNSKICIMPDVHAGVGCTIGTTMTISDRVCPNLVGVDIGCGMYTVKLKESNLDLKKIDEVVHRIPSGFEVWDRIMFDFIGLDNLSCYSELQNVDRIKCSLGTLGGGNHFIELEVDTEGSYYLVVHTGSRNLGKQVAEYHQTKAYNQDFSLKELDNELRYIIINTCLQYNHAECIEQLLKGVKLNTNLPKSELSYLMGQDLKDYLRDMRICQLFAYENRENIVRFILREAGLSIAHDVRFHTVHNYIEAGKFLRKGAVAAYEGSLLLIPLNMRDGSLLCTGKGNPDWNYSAPHGAGRLMSRKMAKETITMQEYKAAMQGVYTTSVNESTLDEAPMAYKSANELIKVIKPTVKIIDVLKPVYNFKADC